MFTEIVFPKQFPRISYGDLEIKSVPVFHWKKQFLWALQLDFGLRTSHGVEQKKASSKAALGFVVGLPVGLYVGLLKTS